MNSANSPALFGRVASLHLHPAEPGTPLASVPAIEAVEAKGILNDLRYFERLSRESGQPTRRQVSLIEREELAEHATALNSPPIPPGAVRANIETEGLNLVSLVGQPLQIGAAVLFLFAPRDPCAKMDALCPGLRARMENGHQGVMAEVIQSGRIGVGDAIRLAEAPGHRSRTAVRTKRAHLVTPPARRARPSRRAAPE